MVVYYDVRMQPVRRVSIRLLVERKEVELRAGEKGVVGGSIKSIYCVMVILFIDAGATCWQRVFTTRDPAYKC